VFTYWIHGGSDEWEYIFIVVPKDGLHPETSNSKQIFPEMKLRGLVPNFHIHGSVSDLLYIFPRSVRSQIHKCGNWEQGRAVSFLKIHKSDLLFSVQPMRTKDYSPHDIIEGVQ
jgi:hypothetical protein